MTQLDIPKQTIDLRDQLRWDWITTALLLKGVSLRGLARELGVEHQTLGIVKYRPFPRMEQAIAEKIGFAPEVIWPERYRRPRARGLYTARNSQACQAGKPPSASKHSKTSKSHNSKKGRAA